MRFERVPVNRIRPLLVPEEVRKILDHRLANHTGASGTYPSNGLLRAADALTASGMLEKRLVRPNPIVAGGAEVLLVDCRDIVASSFEEGSR
jgi:hypothetical protein